MKLQNKFTGLKYFVNKIMHKRKILIVDDEAAIRKLFKKVFSLAGYTVRSVESAEEALEILNKTVSRSCFWI